MVESLRERTPGTRLAALVVLAFVAFTAVQAFQIRVRFYDTYDYLNDARAILGDEGPGAAYYRVHAPVMPLLATLGAAVHDPEDPANRWTWLVPHAMALLLTLLTLAALAAYLARRHGHHFWPWGVAFFVATPAFVRYAPQLLVDIPTAGVVAASLWLWDRVRTDRGWGWPVALGIVWGVAMGLKYSLLVLPGPFVLVAAIEAIVDRRLLSRRNARVLLAGAIGLATFFSILAFTYERIDEAGFSLTRWLNDLGEASLMVRSMEGERRWDYLAMLPSAISPIALALAAFGVPASLRAWRRDLPGLLWLVFFLGLLTIRVPHNELRYLYPALPVLAHLSVLGLRVIWRRVRSARRLLRVALPLALLVAVWPGVRQMAADRAPFFRRPTQQRVAELLVRELPPEGEVYWSRHFVALAPPHPVTFERDEFFSFFHLGHPAIHFLTHRHVVGVSDRSPEVRLRREPGEGDAFVVGALRFHHTTDLLAGNALPATFTIWIRTRHGGEVELERHIFPAADPSP